MARLIETQLQSPAEVFYERFCAIVPQSGRVAPLRHDSDSYSPIFRALEAAETRALRYARNALGLPGYQAIGMVARMGAELARWSRDDGMDRTALRKRLREAAEYGAPGPLSPHWHRLGLLVAAAMQPHPLLRDLSCAPTVVYDESGIRAQCGDAEAVVRGAHWYLPVEEDHARLVALQLALALREQLDEGMA